MMSVHTADKTGTKTVPEVTLASGYPVPQIGYGVYELQEGPDCEDAVLGAIGDGDIGTHFPPSDPQWAGARSGQFLEHAVKIASEAGYRVGNVDLTIICEAPKIGPHRPRMRAETARILSVEANAVSIKATTTEKLGFTGRREGIAAQAIVSLIVN